MEDINQLLADTKNKTLVVVFPHPDDESMATGGLILAAKKSGWKVVVIILTKGGAGKIFIHANGCSLKEVRGKELAAATKILGVDELINEDFDDGKLVEQRNKWIKRLAELINKYKPGLVVTYDPSGFYGHPDHIVVSKEVYRLTPQEEVVFVAVPRMFREKLPLRGMAEVKDLMVEATHQLDLSSHWFGKWRAAAAHASQGLGKSLKMPLWLFMAINHFEYYHLVERGRKYKYKDSSYKI